jgi:hypothetical protein
MALATDFANINVPALTGAGAAQPQQPQTGSAPSGLMNPIQQILQQGVGAGGQFGGFDLTPAQGGGWAVNGQGSFQWPQLLQGMQGAFAGGNPFMGAGGGATPPGQLGQMAQAGAQMAAGAAPGGDQTAGGIPNPPVPKPGVGQQGGAVGAPMGPGPAGGWRPGMPWQGQQGTMVGSPGLATTGADPAVLAQIAQQAASGAMPPGTQTGPEWPGSQWNPGGYGGQMGAPGMALPGQQQQTIKAPLAGGGYGRMAPRFGGGYGGRFGGYGGGYTGGGGYGRFGGYGGYGPYGGGMQLQQLADTPPGAQAAAPGIATGAQAGAPGVNIADIGLMGGFNPNGPQ